MTWLTLENPFLHEFIGLGSRLQCMFEFVLTISQYSDSERLY